MRCPVFSMLCLCVLLTTGCWESFDEVEVSDGVIVNPYARDASTSGTTGSFATSVIATSTTAQSTALPSPTLATTGTTTAPAEPDVITPGLPNERWIGGGCQDVGGCAFADAVCLIPPRANTYPGGHCTQPCTRLCPDRDGSNSLTFCIASSQPLGFAAGHCVSQCDVGLYPGTGCRQGYACDLRARQGDPGTQKSVCVPADQVRPADPGSSECLSTLTKKGVQWTPWNYTTRQPAGSSLMCTIDDPIVVQPQINGVRYSYYNHASPAPMNMSCEMALALWDFGEILRDLSIDHVLHIGTYNCRKISGKDRLSEHSHGRAIDLWGFITSANERLILEEHWEHGTTMPTSPKAKTLYEIGERMHAQKIFHNVLTPNYNAGHDNHFHVDLSPGADFIGSHIDHDPGYFGPEGWEDHCPADEPVH